MRYGAVLLSLLAIAPASGQLITKLSPETNQSFEHYIAAAEPLLIAKARTASSLPWLQPSDVDKVHKGDIVLSQVSAKDGYEVPAGLIHDWVGGIFIKGATVEKVARALQDFDHHKDWYPEILDSKLLSPKSFGVQGTWVLLKESFITVVLRLGLNSELTQVAANHAYIVSRTGPVVEIENYRTAKQSEYAPGEGHGFLWRFNGYWTLHQADDGVYAECRIISLSRGVPAGLGWIVSPIIRSMPRESLESTLRSTRKAVEKQ